MVKKSFIGAKNNTWDITCECGNDTGNAGFDTCNINGERIEPLIGAAWYSHYICNACDLIHEINVF